VCLHFSPSAAHVVVGLASRAAGGFEYHHFSQHPAAALVYQVPLDGDGGQLKVRDASLNATKTFTS
jgi:hypothetical protein